jgi:hypothetical protein
MSTLQSPGVLTKEIDLTTIVPAVATTDGAIAGVFRWGEIGTRILIDSEDQLVARFGRPTNLNAETWFTAASFLAYGNRLWIARAANTTGVSPDLEAKVQANNTIVRITGNNELINSTSLGLEPGLLLLSSTQNGVYLVADTLIDDVINSSAFSISTASDVHTEAAGNTTSVDVTVDSSVNATTLVVLTTGNTDTLEAGFVISDSSNLAVINSSVSAEVVSIVNSTAFVVNSDIIVANGSSTITVTKAGTVQLQFVSNTVFSAVANTGRVANLEFAIIKNEDHFTTKEGNFDTDIKFIARHPGELGNTLRVSVCGNSQGFEETVNLATYGVRAILPITVNSNTADLQVVAANSTHVSANMAALKTNFQVTDLVEVGNTLLGTQFLKVVDISNTSTYGSVNATVVITTSTEDTLVEADSTANLVAGMMLSSAANSYLLDMVVNNVVNSTAFRAVTTPVINSTATVTFSPRATVRLQFEDPFQLGDNYKFSSGDQDQRTIHRTWEFYPLMDAAPGQSPYNISLGNSSINADEMHIVVVDDDGKFTGIPGTVLESYMGVSRGTDAQTVDGENNHWKDVVNDRSRYVYAVNDMSGAASATVENLVDSTLDVLNLPLGMGRDGKSEATIQLSLLTQAYDLFQSKEDIFDLSLILGGRPRSFQLGNYLIDNLSEYRQDCVVFISPQRADVVHNVGNEAAACVNFRGNLRSTSWAVLDSGYKYMYDRYNDLYRWVPLNGDTAGLCVRTDMTNDPWWSPAGLNRGHIKNVVKLAYNPRQADRDTLYRNGINPVISRAGLGTVLWGDKTLLAKPSAFDRINVRRLFIVLRKAIAKAAEYTLFEFNDEFTRSQFKNLVNPYLRDIKGRRGIYDFLVVCDDTNNTPTVIDRNEFIGDIYIKPARSINFITLNFIAVPTGVAFSEVVGKF